MNAWPTLIQVQSGSTLSERSEDTALYYTWLEDPNRSLSNTWVTKTIGKYWKIKPYIYYPAQIRYFADLLYSPGFVVHLMVMELHQPAYTNNKTIV